MINEENLASLSKEQLIELIEIYAKNWLALDGVWFQSVERREGMEEAIYHDLEAWKRFTVIEAKRIKAFLQLPEQAGTDGLARALRYRFYANLNRSEIVKDEKTLVYRVIECRVQTRQEPKGNVLASMQNGGNRGIFRLCASDRQPIPLRMSQLLSGCYRQERLLRMEICFGNVNFFGKKDCRGASGML